MKLHDYEVTVRLTVFIGCSYEHELSERVKDRLQHDMEGQLDTVKILKFKDLGETKC